MPGRWARKRSKVAFDRRTGERLWARPRGRQSTQVIVIETDPIASTDAGGFWWDVAVPATSERSAGRAAAREDYEKALASQRVGD